MSRRLARFKEMKERGYFANRMAEWRARQRGAPAPYELAPRTLAWDIDEYDAYLANRRRLPKSGEAATIEVGKVHCRKIRSPSPVR
jgi:hypothetical protein